MKYLLLLMLGILAASCVFDAEECVMPADEPRSIMFTVSLDNQRTKADTWGDEYASENGVPFDYRIIPEDLRVVVLAHDGTRVGTIEDLGYWPLNESHTEFQFMGQMPAGFAEYFNEHTDNLNYKFMVIANCGDNLTGEHYITYSHSQLDPSSDDASIPMWGVKEVNLYSLMNDQSMDLGDIWLLRAAAKIEVKLSDHLKTKDTKIESATLKYYNQTGYALPEGWSNVSDTKRLNQENCIRIYRHTAVNLPFIKDEVTGDYYVYVTEYDNKNYAEERNKISLDFTINDVSKSFTDAISFCNYSGGKPQEGSDYDIVRNHIYEFEILSIAGDNLVLEYTVAEWDVEDWGDGKDHEEHQLAYPTYHNPVLPVRYLTSTPAELVNFTITEQPKMYYNANKPEAGAFECFFQITAPEDVKWKPGFNGSKEKYGVRVYKDASSTATGTKVFDSTENWEPDLGALTNGWYRIVVFPRGADGAGSEDIEFIISYYQLWTDQYIHLYINGEYDQIRWPDSGDNPKIIKIRHVAQETNVIDE